MVRGVYGIKQPSNNRLTNDHKQKGKTMTIYEIKERTRETSPYFFERKTMKFFGQTMKSFRVYKQKDGKYLIVAPWGPGCPRGVTRRLFNPKTNDLEII
jgi:hypothetical protein